MKRILITLLLATTAHAGDRWIVQTNESGVSVTFHKSIPSDTPLFDGEVARYGSFSAPYDVTGYDVVTNEIEGVVTNEIRQAVPNKYWKWDGDVVAMTQVERDAYDQAEAAAIQAATYAQLQAVIDAAGDEIRTLEGIIDFFELTRPVDPKSAINEIKTIIEGKGNSQDKAIANTLALQLMALFNGLSDAGIDAATISAVWQYMIATGQN